MDPLKVIPKSTERGFTNTRPTADFFPVFKIRDSKSTAFIPSDIKTSDCSRKCEERNAGTDMKHSTTTISEKPELPSIEKLCITQNYDSSSNSKAKNSPIESPKRSANNDKPKNSRRLSFKATPASSKDLKGFDKIFERNVKPEERNGITEEADRGELLIEKRIIRNSHETLPFKNSQFKSTPDFDQEKNYEPQASCRIDKDAVIRLTRLHSIKDFSDEKDFINRFFRIEVAFYEYLELYVFRSNHLDRCTLFTFAWHVYNLEPSLRIYLDNLSMCYKEWKKFKYSLPTYGAALLSEEASHVVMVQSSICKNSWGFPKGKIMRNEDPVSCAIREVREEVGFDIQHLIKDDKYIEYLDSQGRKFGLYIIEGIPRNTKFSTKCKYEIKAIEWKSLEELVPFEGKFLINIVSRHFIPLLKDKRISPKKLNKIQIK